MDDNHACRLPCQPPGGLQLELEMCRLEMKRRAKELHPSSKLMEIDENKVGEWEFIN